MHAPGHIQAAREPLLHSKHLTFNFLWSSIRIYEVIDSFEQCLHSDSTTSIFSLHPTLCFVMS